VPPQQNAVVAKAQHKTTMGDMGENGVSSMLKEVQELAEKFKVEEDEQYISPYAHLEKAQGRSWHCSNGAVVTRLLSLEDNEIVLSVCYPFYSYLTLLASL
jgi:hypothetical protein